MRFQSTLPLRGATTSKKPIKTYSRFQSTLPLRGATEYPYTPPLNVPNFNPRSPYGERQVFPGQKVIKKKFQSTLPLRGATHATFCLCQTFEFQSTLPLRGATWSRRKAPLRGKNFNPRSPYGERPGINVDFNGNRLFQSTLPLRGAT